MEEKDPLRPQPFPFAEPQRRPQKISEAQKRRIKLIETNITRTIEEMGQLHDMKMHIQAMKEQVLSDLAQETLIVRQLEEWYKFLLQKAEAEAKERSTFTGSSDRGNNSTSSFPWLAIEGRPPAAKVMKEEKPSTSSGRSGSGKSKNETPCPWTKNEGHPGQVVKEEHGDDVLAGMKVENFEPIDFMDLD